MKRTINAADAALIKLNKQFLDDAVAAEKALAAAQYQIAQLEKRLKVAQLEAQLAQLKPDKLDALEWRRRTNTSAADSAAQLSY